MFVNSSYCFICWLYNRVSQSCFISSLIALRLIVPYKMLILYTLFLLPFTLQISYHIGFTVYPLCYLPTRLYYRLQDYSTTLLVRSDIGIYNPTIRCIGIYIYIHTYICMYYWNATKQSREFSLICLVSMNPIF